MIKIIIADDFILVREGVKEILLQSSLDISIVAEAGNPTEVMQLLSQHSKTTDLLILDISMPGNIGLQTLKKVKRQYPDLDVLILSIHKEEDFAPRALKEGASGYVMKSSVPEDLVTAIRQIVINKEKYVSPRVTKFLARKPEQNEKWSLLCQSLSGTEFNILGMFTMKKNVVNVAKDKVSELTRFVLQY